MKTTGLFFETMKTTDLWSFYCTSNLLGDHMIHIPVFLTIHYDNQYAIINKW